MALADTPKKDWFNTYLYIYLILAVIVPLIFVASILFQKKQVAIQVVAPKEYSNKLNEFQQIDLKNAEKGNISSQNIGLDYKDSKTVPVKILTSGLEKAVIKVSAGDTVVFINSTLRPVTVAGEGWGSGQTIPPSKSYGQKFDFSGQYSFTAGTVSGKVVVE